MKCDNGHIIVATDGDGSYDLPQCTVCSKPLPKKVGELNEKWFEICNPQYAEELVEDPKTTAAMLYSTLSLDMECSSLEEITTQKQIDTTYADCGGLTD